MKMRIRAAAVSVAMLAGALSTGTTVFASTWSNGGHDHSWSGGRWDHHNDGHHDHDFHHDHCCDNHDHSSDNSGESCDWADSHDHDWWQAHCQ